MGFRCNKCGFYKMTKDQKCSCNVKKFDSSKLSKKTRKETVPKPINKISEKKKERIKTNGSEVDLFKKIFKKKFKEKENFCIICKEEITEENVQPASFPHILPKGKYPELRYMESNLQYLVCGINHHDEYDSIINKLKKDLWLEEGKKIITSWGKLDLNKYLDYGKI